MVTLGLGLPTPNQRSAGAPVTPAGPHAIVPRRVIVWVGVPDAVVAGMRERLPGFTFGLLGDCDQGLKRTFTINGSSVVFRRIRYDRRTPLGYGIIVAEWETIAPLSQKMTIPDGLNTKLSEARSFVIGLGLLARTHLIDRRP